MRVYAPIYYPVDQFTLCPPLPSPNCQSGVATREWQLHSPGRSRRMRSRNIRDAQTRTGRISDTMVASERVVCAAVGFRYGPRPVASSSSVGGERSVGRSVRPSSWDPDARRICPPTARRRLLLSFASPPSPPPCPPPSRRSPSLRSRAPPRGLFHRLLPYPGLRLCLFSSPYTTSVVTPPALPPSSASSSCRYRYHYHCPRHYHRRDGVDDASSSAFSWPSPPAESTWWLPHHLGDPAPLSTNDQRLSLLRGANRAHGSSRDLSPLCSWASVLPASLLVAYAVSSEAEDAGGRLTSLVNNETYHALDRYFSRKLRFSAAFHSCPPYDNCHFRALASLSINEI